MVVVIKIMVFWGIVLCGPVDRYQCFGKTCSLYLQGKGIAFSLKVERAGFFKMLVLIYQSIWYHITDDRNLKLMQIM
jgi:hypothetical protein